MVTVTYNSGPGLEPFLSSAADLIRSSRCVLHLLVVDNDSRDGTRDVLRGYVGSAVSLIENLANVGVSRANNQGIRVALEKGYEYVLLVNNDTVLPDGLVDRLIASGKQLGAQMIAPRIVWMDRPEVDWYSGGEVNEWRGFAPSHDEHADSNVPRLTGYASTCCLLVCSETFRTVGLMDERYFVYWDDVDFMIRVKRHGQYVGIDPGVTVRHAAASSTGGKKSPFSIKHSSYGRALLASIHTSGLRRGWQAMYLTAWTLARVLLRRDTLAEAGLRCREYLRGWQVGRTTTLPSPAAQASASAAEA